MTLDMHTLERAWQGLDTRLASQALELRALREHGALSGARARLRLVSAGQVVQLAFALAIVLWAGSYWFEHLETPHLAVFGIAIHVYGIAALVAPILQLARLARIDYRAPVLELQRELIGLRKHRARAERVLLMLGFALWAPVAFIALAAIGVDVWATSPASVWANVLAGLAFGAVALWLSYRYRDSFERDSAGRSLREAEADLEAVSSGS